MDGLGYTMLIEFVELLARRRGSALDRYINTSHGYLSEMQW